MPALLIVNPNTSAEVSALLARHAAARAPAGWTDTDTLTLTEFIEDTATTFILVGKRGGNAGFVSCVNYAAITRESVYVSKRVSS